MTKFKKRYSFQRQHLSGHRYIPNNSYGKYIFLSTSELVSITLDPWPRGSNRKVFSLLQPGYASIAREMVIIVRLDFVTIHWIQQKSFSVSNSCILEILGGPSVLLQRVVRADHKKMRIRCQATLILKILPNRFLIDITFSFAFAFV